QLSIDGRPAWAHPWIRQRLVQLAIASEALKYTRLRSLTRQLRGEPPGPEGSILKLTGSELGVRIAEVAGELLGMHVLVNAPSVIVPDAPRWFNRVLAARQYTISAGTTEPQRARIAFGSSSGVSRLIGIGIQMRPGHTALTRMPSGA